MKAILFANTDWYLYNFRIEFAKFLIQKGWEVIFMAPSGEYCGHFESEGIRFIPFELSRKSINPITENQTIKRIEEIYDREKPDLVHHFTVKCVIYGSIAAKRNHISAVINSITGLGYVFLGKSILAKSLRILVKKLYCSTLENTQVIFENPDDAALFNQMGLCQTQNTNIILGTGVDTNTFIPVPPPNSKPLVVLLARMLWDKGIGEFVAAATILKEKGIQARFALVGKNDQGNPTSIPFEQLSQWQKEGNVEWWGWQEDVIAVFSMSDIICLPSYREGLSRVLIEAAACSRPIVTTDVPGCKDVVDNGVNGYLVPAKDAVALAAAMEKLINDRELRITMGEKGREIAVSVFSVERVNNALFSVYKKSMS